MRRLSVASSISAAVLLTALGASTCCRPAEIGRPHAPGASGGPGADAVAGSGGFGGGDGAAGTDAGADGPAPDAGRGADAAGVADATPTDGGAVDGRDPTIEGPAVGLYSETHAWVNDDPTAPRMLLYFQSGSQGGLHIYDGNDFDPQGANPWFDVDHRDDPVEGERAIWYRHPPLGADSPAIDAQNASARILWRTFGRSYDLSAYRYANLWVKPLDGFEGFLGLTLASWDPAAGGGSGDDGVHVSRRFPQRIRGSGWQSLSVELSDLAGFEPGHFAKFVLDFPGTADGRAFLLDNLTFSAQRPRAAGPEDPDVYSLTEPGEDPSAAADRVTLIFDRGAQHQTIRGFGFFGDSPSKARLISDLGASLIRIEIPAGDPPGGVAATRANTFGWEPVDDGGDDRSFVNGLDGFDTADVAPILESMRGFRAVDPDVQFFACAWSPPGWMKNGGRVNDGTNQGNFGNAIAAENLGEYGEYLAAFALHLHREGLPLLALSMGNEVHFNHSFPSMYLVGDDMRAAIRETAARLDLAEQSVPGFDAPLLTADDHVLNDYFYESGFVPLLEGLGADAVAGGAIDVVSYHSYGVDAQTPENVPNTVLARLRSKVTAELGADTELWMTETSGFHNGLLDDGDRRGALAMAEGIHTSLAYANAGAWVYFGAGELLHFGQLSWPGHALRHYARFIRPGAVRFEAGVDRLADRVLVSAFESNDAIAVVIVNVDDVPHGLDLSALPRLDGQTRYREFRSSRHHAGEDMGEMDPAATAQTPYVLPPQAIVTLYQGPPLPDA